MTAAEAMAYAEKRARAEGVWITDNAETKQFLVEQMEKHPERIPLFIQAVDQRFALPSRAGSD